MLPHPVQDNNPETSIFTEHSDSGEAIIPAAPACACLPNSYLTLSSLSSLASFPISVHTIESLQTAHRTVHSVLYCPICPTKFQSGMQNVMMSGTVLTVLADNWHRVRKAPAEELRSGFSPPRASSLAERPPLTEGQSEEWRTFAFHVLRANVFGDESTPFPPCHQSSTEHRPESILPIDHGVQQSHPLASINTSSTPTLLSLVDAMERRQACWHGKMPDTGEFPKRMSQSALGEHMQGLTSEQLKEAEMEQDGHLCLRLVQSARAVLRTLDQQEPTLQ